jgi:hypothetical protein
MTPPTKREQLAAMRLEDFRALFEIALVLVRLYNVASVIVNANHSIM